MKIHVFYRFLDFIRFSWYDRYGFYQHDFTVFYDVFVPFSSVLQ